MKDTAGTTATDNRQRREAKYREGRKDKEGGDLSRSAGGVSLRQKAGHAVGWEKGNTRARLGV